MRAFSKMDSETDIEPGCKVIKKVLKLALITAAFIAVTGCASPTVKTNVAISSKLSMTPDLNPGLHAMPDWGDKIAIVPASKSKQNDATYRSIASSMQNVLAAAHLETVKAGSGEKYRMSIDWSVKPSRIIQRSESVPVTYLGGGFGWGWGHHRHWHGPYAGFGPQVAFATRVYNQQLYMRELDVKLLEMKGSRATTVFTAIVKNEATCNRIDDILPYMVKSAIDNLYAQDGTVKVVELPEVSEVCR